MFPSLPTCAIFGSSVYSLVRAALLVLPRLKLLAAVAAVNGFVRCPAGVHTYVHWLERTVAEAFHTEERKSCAHLWLSLVTLFNRALFTVPLI